MDKYEALKQYFGHGRFRPGQEELVDALLAGRDVLGIMPTGAGKSICYQIPALLLPGTALVISPLISLMEDQVAALGQAGVPAAFLNSSLAPEEYQDTLRRARQGAYKLIYAAPERLAAPGFLRFAQEAEFSLLAVDEAHCLSQWGQDFRPSYLKIAGFLASLPRRPAVGAFTATATPQVEADIVRLLPLRAPVRAATGFDRPNLYFETVRPRRKGTYLKQYLQQRSGQSGIVYCATRKTVDSLWAELVRAGFSAVRYHAGLPDEERRRAQEDFVYDRARIMVATNAFGMGIDKSNVGFVVHYNMPKDLESYYQEAGRAGRDGAYARCTLLFGEGDVYTAKYLINNSSDSEALPGEQREALRLQDLRRLEQMTAYCKTTGCLRAYLLRYFGQEAPDRCGRCSSCTGELERQDITVEAQKILSAVTRVERQHRSGLGVALIVQLLRGGKGKRVLQLGLDQLPTYGAMAGVERALVRDYIDTLIEQGYLYLDGVDYPVLRTTPQARQVLFHGQTVVRLAPRREAEEGGRAAAPAPAAPAPADAPDPGLLDALRALRSRLAAEGKVPAYMVFSNASLAEMALRRPRTLEEFLEVPGVGAVKAERFGQAFLEAIARHPDGPAPDGGDP